MWQDFADYILNEAGSQEIKIAEIGVGKFDKISAIMSNLPTPISAILISWFPASFKI